MINLRNELQGREGFCTAVIAMIDGLLKQDKRKNFTVTMHTFGRSSTGKGKICYGCAATCAIQQYFGVNFNTKNIWDEIKRAEAVNTSYSALDSFEMAINGLRLASTLDLSSFCSLSNSDSGFVYNKFTYLLPLHNEHWRKDIHQYEKALREVMEKWNLEFTLEDVA